MKHSLLEDTLEVERDLFTQLPAYFRPLHLRDLLLDQNTGRFQRLFICPGEINMHLPTVGLLTEIAGALRATFYLSMLLSNAEKLQISESGYPGHEMPCRTG